MPSGVRRKLTVKVLLRCAHRFSLPIALPYHRFKRVRRPTRGNSAPEERVRDYQDHHGQQPAVRSARL